jgi:hypothetical protein
MPGNLREMFSVYGSVYGSEGGIAGFEVEPGRHNKMPGNLREMAKTQLL